MNGRPMLKKLSKILNKLALANPLFQSNFALLKVYHQITFKLIYKSTNNKQI